MNETLRLDPKNDLLKARLAQGAIEVSMSALVVAHDYSLTEFEAAINRYDFEAALEWRNEQANIGAALRGQGFVPSRRGATLKTA